MLYIVCCPPTAPFYLQNPFDWNVISILVCFRNAISVCGAILSLAIFYHKNFKNSTILCPAMSYVRLLFGRFDTSSFLFAPLFYTIIRPKNWTLPVYYGSKAPFYMILTLRSIKRSMEKSADTSRGQAICRVFLYF